MEAVLNYIMLAAGLVILLLSAFVGLAGLQAILNYHHETDAQFISWLLLPIATLLFIAGGYLSFRFGKRLIK